MTLCARILAVLVVGVLVQHSVFAYKALGGESNSKPVASAQAADNSTQPANLVHVPLCSCLQTRDTTLHLSSNCSDWLVVLMRYACYN